MPGKGAYWKKGGLIDETVKEEDLSQALQAKVNSGGGSWEKVGEDKLTVAGSIMTVTPSPSIVKGAVNQILIIVQFQPDVGLSTCLIDIGGAGGSWNNRGLSSDGTTILPISRNGISNIGSGLDFQEDGGNVLKCELYINDIGSFSNLNAQTVETSRQDPRYRVISSDVDSPVSAITEINAVTNNNFRIGSSLSVYKLKV